MKILLLFVCVCIGASQQMNFDKIIDDLEDAIDKGSKECYDEFKLSRQQLDSMFKMKDLPNSRDLKCDLACIYIHLNFVDGSFTMLTDKVKRYSGVDEATAEIVYNKCKNLKGEDNCEKAFNSANCIREELRNL
ncbi:hypothetical protein FQA39_LY13759 [Lamprigera yunnana]|nr:hypothetical protein FQA39_LY13759 [Lamprigera yunnana]